MNRKQYQCLNCGSIVYSPRCSNCGGDAEPIDTDGMGICPPGGDMTDSEFARFLGDTEAGSTYTIFDHAQLGHKEPRK